MGVGGLNGQGTLARVVESQRNGEGLRFSNHGLGDDQPSLKSARRATPRADGRSPFGGLRQDLEQLAVAVTRYRFAHGRHPTTLDELVPRFIPQLPLEPFHHSPYRLRQTKDGITIYSVGYDGVDDLAQMGIGDELTFELRTNSDAKDRLGR